VWTASSPSTSQSCYCQRQQQCCDNILTHNATMSLWTQVIYRSECCQNIASRWHNTWWRWHFPDNSDSYKNLVDTRPLYVEGDKGGVRPQLRLTGVLILCDRALLDINPGSAVQYIISTNWQHRFHLSGSPCRAIIHIYQIMCQNFIQSAHVICLVQFV